MRGFAALVSVGVAVSVQAQDAPARKPADCSIVRTYLGGSTPAIRVSRSPSPERRGPREQLWGLELPYLKSVARCGHLYVFQVWTRSKDAWVIDRARLEGPKSEVFPAVALHFNGLNDGIGVNVIVTEALPGPKPPKSRLHLIGRDGRVAQLEAMELP